MSKKNEKKSWTFVPERSRQPVNKRATRRKTTLRAFTFVQDWDPSPKHNAGQNKQSSHKKDRSQPASSLSSENSIRESPIAQLIRSSPAPIIVARRIPGSRNKSIRSPRPLSPSTSASSLVSSSSSKKNSSSQRPSDNIPPLQGKTGVSPVLPVSRTRGKPPSGRKRKSPRTHEQSVAGSFPPGGSEGGEENVLEASLSGVGNDATRARLEDVLDKSQVESEPATKNKRHLGALSEVPRDVSLPGSPRSDRYLRSTTSLSKKQKKITPDAKPSETPNNASIQGSPISERSTRSVTRSRKEQNKESPDGTPPKSSEDVNKSTSSGSERSTISRSSRKEQKDKRSNRKTLETPSDVTKPESEESGKSSSSTRSRKRRGPSLTFQKKVRKGRTSLSFNAEDNVQSVSNNERIASDDGETDPTHIPSASDSEPQASRTSPRLEQGPKSPPRKGSAKRKTRQPSSRDDSDSTGVPVESDVPTPGSAKVPQRLSTSTDRSRSSSSRRKRAPSLTFKKKSAKKLTNPTQEGVSSTERVASSSQIGRRKKLPSTSSASDKSSPEAVIRRKTPGSGVQKSFRSSESSKKGKKSLHTSVAVSSTTKVNSRRKLLSSSGGNRKGSSNRSSSSSGLDTSASKEDSRRRLPLKGPRSTEKTPTGKSGSKKKGSVSKIQPQELGKTPDRSMSFFAATPKSGHVVRHKPKANQGSRPRTGPGPGTSRQRKRATAEISSDEEPVEKRAKVRLYKTGARPRLVGDTTDLDILFNCLEDTALDFRESLDTPSDRKAVTKFLEQAKRDLTEKISMQHEFKLQTLSLSRTNAAIRKYRNELLNLQRESARLDMTIKDLKKKQDKSDYNQAKMLRGIDSFITDLTHLHKAYVSKYPKDIKSVEPVALDEADKFSSQLNPTLELQSSATSLNSKLREWMGLQTIQN